MHLDLITKEDFQVLTDKVNRLLAHVLPHSSEPGNQIYCNESVAKRLGVSKKTLSNWRNSGRIEYSQVGRKIFYTEEQIQEFLSNSINKAF